jgi:predicted porin
MAKLLAQYGSQEVEGTAAFANRELRHWLIGGLIPVGAGEIRVAYGAGKRDDSGAAGGANDGAKVRQWALGYVHNFSKRTAVYATYANQRATGGTAGTQAAVQAGNASASSGAGGRVSANGFDLGIRHSF